MKTEAEISIERRTMISLAGKLGERRLKRDNPYPREVERKAAHESAHACVAHFLAFHVYQATVIPDRSRKTMNGGGYSGGHFTYGPSKEPPRSETPIKSSVIVTDVERAAQYAHLLAWTQTPNHWKATLALIRKLRADTEALVEYLWPTISLVASHLVEAGELHQEEIDRLIRQRVA